MLRQTVGRRIFFNLCATLVPSLFRTYSEALAGWARISGSASLPAAEPRSPLRPTGLGARNAHVRARRAPRSPCAPPAPRAPRGPRPAFHTCARARKAGPRAVDQLRSSAARSSPGRSPPACGRLASCEELRPAAARSLRRAADLGATAEGRRPSAPLSLGQGSSSWDLGFPA